MILTSLLLVAVPSPIAVVEMPDPRADRLRIEIVARLSIEDAKDWAAANVLRDVLAKGTDHFTESELFAYVTQMGDPLRVTLAADHLRIGFSLPPGAVELGAQIASELVRSASVPAKAVEESVGGLPFRRRTAWSWGWLPFEVAPSSVSRVDVLEIYRRAFRPDNVVVAIGGKVAPGSGRSAMEKRFSAWSEATRPPRRRIPGTHPRLDSAPYLAVQVVAITGPSIQVVPRIAVDAAPTDPTFPEAALTCSMLGQGKGSTLFQVLREQLALSYCQEAFLVPTFTGLHPRIIFASTSPVDESLVRKSLREGIEKWSEADRLRSLRFGEANTQQDLGLGVMYLMQDRPLNEALEDRTFVAAYWKSLTGRAWDPKALHKEMEAVTLDRCKQIARQWASSGFWSAAGKL